MAAALGDARVTGGGASGTAVHLFDCRLAQSQPEQITEICRDESASFKAAESVT